MSYKLDPVAIRRAVDARFGTLWRENFLHNLPAIRRGSGDLLAVADGYRGRAAVLVGAGPSLDGTLPYFRAIPRGWKIICADAALSPLLSARIRPDLVFCVDPQPGIARFFAGLDTRGLTLAACSVVHPQALALWRGPVCYYHQTGTEIDALKEIAAGYPPLPGLDVGGTVLTVAYSFARLAGCSPIVFTGQDLCFDRGRTHCAGADTGGDGGAQNGQYARYLIEETDIHGGKILNLPPMSYSTRWFEEKFRAGGFINASERGIMPGEAIPLREALWRDSQRKGKD